MDEQEEGGAAVEVDPKIAAEAADVGWKPLEQFKGRQEDWVGPEEYLERSKHVMPVLRANNERLKNELANVRQANEALKSSVEDMRKNMTEFSKAQTELLKDKLAEQRATLIAARKEARDEGDAAAEGRIEDALEENRDKAKALATAPPPPPPPPAPAPMPPELQEWVAENPWFGKDKRRTAIAMAAAQEATEEGITQGKALFKRMDDAIEEVFPSGRAVDKTEGGRPSGRDGGGRTNGSAYDALPAEAKAQAKRDAERFVGKDKMFKTAAEWNVYFAEQYNSVA